MRSRHMKNIGCARHAHTRETRVSLPGVPRFLRPIYFQGSATQAKYEIIHTRLKFVLHF